MSDMDIGGWIEQYLDRLPDEVEGACPVCACTYRDLTITIHMDIDEGYGPSSQPIGSLAVCHDCGEEYTVPPTT